MLLGRPGLELRFTPDPRGCQRPPPSETDLRGPTADPRVHLCPAVTARPAKGLPRAWPVSARTLVVRPVRDLSWALAGLALLAGVGLFLSARLEAPLPTLVLLDRHGYFLGEVGGSEARGNGYWPLEGLPPRVVAATLAAEDRRFWTHPGVDPLAVGRALWQNLRHATRVSGASTLAMQVARLQNPAPRTYRAKLREALVALALTGRHGREAVLAHYLRLAPYGNQVHGIAAAARRYFDKPVEDLGWAEVALLAAIPQAPGRLNPLTPQGRQRAGQRAGRILARLREAGELPASEHALAVEQLRALAPRPPPRRPAATLHALFSLPGELAAAGVAGQAVVTTLDLDLQQDLARLAGEAVASWAGQGAANVAVMVVDLPTREVLAALGSVDYFDGRRSGAVDFTRVPRSPGSTLKPFLYALALERGLITPATVLDDLPGVAPVQNADGRFLGPLLPRVALANSRNVPAVDLLRRVGLDTAFAFLQDLGLHSGTAPPRRYGLGLAVGGMPVSLAQLATAYGALAGDGRLGRLRWQRGEPNEASRRVLSEATARRLTLMLADPQARLPTFPRMGHLEYPFPVAVKTGTSSFWHDAWAVAWSRRYLVVAWVGRPDGRAMEGLGGYASASLARQVLHRLQPQDTDGLGEIGFPPPREHQPVRVCALTGRRATPACEQVLVEYFAPGEAPLEPCQAHQRLAVDARDGLLATSRTPGEFLDVRTFLDLGPRYAGWQAGRGYPPPPRDLSPLGAGAAADGWTLTVTGAAQPATPVRPRVRITSPAPGLRVVRDPEAPASAGIALSAVVDPPVEQVVWYVDGQPYRVAERPYTVRWALAPGVHVIQARLPFLEASSEPVRVTVY